MKRLAPHIATEHRLASASRRRSLDPARRSFRTTDNAFGHVRKFRGGCERLLERATCRCAPSSSSTSARRRHRRRRPLRRSSARRHAHHASRRRRRRSLRSRSASSRSRPRAPEGDREPAARPADHARRSAEGRPQLPPGHPDGRRRGRGACREQEFKRVLAETQLGQPDGRSARRHGRARRLEEPRVRRHRRDDPAAGRRLLAGLFDMVADTVRQRQQFTARSSGLTAMGRMAAYVLVGLPFFIGGVISS